MRRKTNACAFLLALLMLLPACQSFSDENVKNPADTAPASESATDTTETEPTETRPLPNGAENNFDGENFRVAFRFGSNSYNCNDILAEEGMTGDLINDTVYHRNVQLEDALGIRLVGMPMEEPIEFVRKDFRGGDNSYDVVLERMNSLYPAALDQHFGDWYAAPYFDTEKPWWDENCAKELSLHHKLYVMASEVSMITPGEVRFLYYNKRLMQDNNLGNPYALVESGTWTMEEMLRMVSSIAEDLNGDGMMDGRDRYGLLKESATFFINGCGVLFTTKDENDLPVVDCINERTVTVLEWINKLFSDETHTCSFETVAKGQDTSAFRHMWAYGRSRFAAGQFLFVQNGASDAPDFIDMEDKYGVLPNPKLDEAQEEYYHLIDPFAPAWAYAAGTKNPALTSAAMEMWGYLSDDLVEAFYETTLKKRRFDAPEDAAMLDIIRSSIRYEISTLCDLGVQDLLNTSYSKGNLMSNYERRRKMITNKLARIVEKISD